MPNVSRRLLAALLGALLPGALAATLVPELDVGGPNWRGYFVRPTTLITTALQPDDRGCGQNASGLLHEEPAPLAPGTYLVEFQGRSLRGTLPVSFGLNDLLRISVRLAPQWQSFGQTFTLTPDHPSLRDPRVSAGGRRLFQVFEAVRANPGWEVRAPSVRLKRPDGSFSPNLLASQDGASPYWAGYCAKPPARTTLTFLARDFAPDNPRSGVYRVLPPGQRLPGGRYRVSLEARALSAPLRIVYGVNDHATVTADLTPNWQRLTHDFTVPAPTAGQDDADRLFQVFEVAPRNSTWEVREVVVEPLR